MVKDETNHVMGKHLEKIRRLDKSIQKMAIIDEPLRASLE